MIDIEKLLVDHDGDSVCGSNYEYNSLMVEMRTAIQGKPEQRLGDGVIEAEEPDWKLVKKNCLELCKKTHHLELNVSLTQALMNLRGFAGLATGSELLAGVIEHYWGCLYPQIDPADKDPIERLNQLAIFDDFSFLMSVRKVEFISPKIASVSLYSIERSKKYKDDKEGDAPDPKLLNAAFKSGNQEDIENVYSSLDSCIANFQRISSTLQQDDYVGVNQAPSFQELLKLLNNAKNVVAEHLNNIQATTDYEEGMMDTSIKQVSQEGQIGSSVTSNAAGQNAIQGIHQGINSREAAIAALEEVEAYFTKNEPSSPIPFMLQRTKGMVDKDFVSLMEDLAPDGIRQVETVFGTSDS